MNNAFLTDSLAYAGAHRLRASRTAQIHTASHHKMDHVFTCPACTCTVQNSHLNYTCFTIRKGGEKWNSQQIHFNIMGRNARAALSHRGSPTEHPAGLQQEDLPPHRLTDSNLPLAIVMFNCILETLQFSTGIDNHRLSACME